MFLSIPQRHIKRVEVLAPFILILRTGWRCVVRFMPWPAYAQGKKPQYPLNRRLSSVAYWGSFGTEKPLGSTGI
jgi:hypothetical protein